MYYHKPQSLNFGVFIFFNQNPIDFGSLFWYILPCSDIRILSCSEPIWANTDAPIKL